jgi:hypothetical protein
MFIRESGNNIWLPRRNAAEEKELDALYWRIGKLHWYKKPDPEDVAKLAGIFNTNHIHIIGKGPSLDSLETIGDGLIVCINDSVNRVHSLGYTNAIMYQLDNNKDVSCSVPCLKILGPEARNLHSEPKIVIDDRRFGCVSHRIGLTSLICIGKWFGVREYTLHCFDAIHNGTLGYANTIGYETKKHGPENRFLQHRAFLDFHSTGCTIRIAQPNIASYIL